ncbi:hypothetical protein CGLO_12576 [Colletotrichum gloeosporioides Cg-14]|uniref:Uncharacterized protein n=1 Tax=Colletotrichum gloeosporioides (strain Cg-14) TaxID=1237896 RepID=T0K871_COLGC|nr:hypothetical protein CGLO_12576 [Colletotrichum gloeosporioides Cg-14]
MLRDFIIRDLIVTL